MSELKIIDQPSPNFGPRPAGVRPSLVILHYTGMRDGASALQRLCDPVSKVSAHYLIEEDGRIFRLVEETQRAWHAGVSSWRGERDINSHSIGIEIVNPGHEHGYRAFLSGQIAAVKDLCVAIAARYQLSPAAFLAHSDIAPARKEDPGELFPWPQLAGQGIGLWPQPTPADAAPMDEAEAIALLTTIGYAAPDKDLTFAKLLLAFQRHYDPQNLSSALNGATPARLRALNALNRH